MHDPVTPFAGQRWLLVAPHPDDEVFAAAITLQRLAAAGAAVRVLLVTDGDNNPWPQRLVERRLSIGEVDRQRWGARRRGEVEASLAALGLDPASVLQPLGWPDGGVEARVLADPAGSVGAIAAVIDAFAPTHLLAPSAADRHPDHNMLALLTALACRRHPELVRQAYRVHAAQRTPNAALVASPAERTGRDRALACHRSQLLLSERRMRRFAEDSDRFLDFDGEFVIRPLPTAAEAPSRRHALLVAEATDEAVQLRRYRQADLRAGREQDGRRRSGAGGCFWKWIPERRGLWIYDAVGWSRTGS